MENPRGGGVIVVNEIFEKNGVWELNNYLHPLARG